MSLRYGKIHLVIDYGRHHRLEFESVSTYNSGAWVKVEAARALRNEVETGLLRINFNGVREDLMNTIDLPLGLSFNMEKCDIFFGGVSPMFRHSDLSFKSFLGGMRSITLSNPGSNNILNPLYVERFKYNPYFGVEPHCEKKLIPVVSFDGNGMLEIASQNLKVNSTFGLGFRTVQPDGLLLLSTFQGALIGS